MDNLKQDKAPAGESASHTHAPGEASARFLMLGCGRMGGALLDCWHAIDGFHFTAVSPSGSRRLPEQVRMVRSCADLGDATFDHLIVAIKPQMVADVLPDYLDRLAPGGAIFSLAAGLSCDSLGEVAGSLPVVRIMPNLPVAIGQGVSGLYAAAYVNDAQRAAAESLMQPTGHLIWTSTEDELDRFTAVAGSGPGYAFELMRCWTTAAEKLGFEPHTARELVLRTLQGAAAMALGDDRPPAQLRDAVTSRRGTTQAGLEALNDGGVLDTHFDRALQAAYARAVELR